MALPDRKLFVIPNNINIIKRITLSYDPLANFFMQNAPNFGFIHASTSEKCTIIFNALLYYGIKVERSKGYINPRAIETEHAMRLAEKAIAQAYKAYDDFFASDTEEVRKIRKMYN